LLAHTGWFETAPLISSFQLSAYADALEGQKLLFVHVWMLAGRRDVMSIRTLLEDDLTFWRKTLAESDLLISKMIAVAAIKRHFAWSNIALRRLPAVIAMQAVPPVWMKPFDEAERSLRRSLTGEWVLSDSGLREAKSGGANPLVEFFESDEESTSKHLLWLALRSMLQPQDLSNRYAELMEIMIESLNVPLEQYPQAIERVRALQHQAAEITLPPRRVYNVMGDILFAMAAPEFTRYATRVADLEGIRRAAVLATELRSQGVSPAQVHQHLQAAENRDPYDGSPFTWDASADAIIFYGLEPGERGRHRFFY
jgi:hypothetical protein